MHHPPPLIPPACVIPERVSRRHRRGFTLIELLTVVAIIGILSALVLTSIGAVRKSARRAQNVSNLKSLMQGWQLYAADNRDSFPLGLTWEPNSVINPPALKTLNYRYWWRWYGGIAPYLPTLTVGDTEASNSYGGPKAPMWDTVYQGYFPPEHFEAAKELELRTGYHFNSYMGLNRRIRQNSITAPSRTPVLFAYRDTASSQNQKSYFCDPVGSFDASYRTRFMAGAPAAMGSGNHFAFADGHVQWVPRMATAKDYEDAMRWRP